MKLRSGALVVVVVLGACGTPPPATDQPNQAPQAAPAVPADTPAAHVAKAHALLESWKGEIEVLEKARHELEAAWKLDPKNPAAMKEFERYQVVRKQMYEIQRKSRGGPAVAEIRSTLDSWSGRSEVHVRAQQLLDKLLVEDPYNAYAPIEAGRLEMQRGFLNNRPALNGKFFYVVGNYAPNTFARAAAKVATSMRYDPLAIGDASVMQAFIAFHQSQLGVVELLLKQAESRGATDPTRHFYWADLHAARGEYAAAIERIQRAVQEQGGVKIAMLRANTRLASIYDLMGQPDKAIAAHKALIQIEPENAWIHGNYAWYLCNSLGRNEEALAEISTALRLMNYGAGHIVLADALYGKWADMVAERKPGADLYLEEARRIKPNLDDVMAYGAARPAGERLAKALVAHGVSINARAERDGSTALLIATNLSRAKTVKFLLDMKANPNIAAENGLTPLLSASSNGDNQIVSMLLAKKADIRATIDGKDAAALAEANGHPELATLLRKKASASKR